MAELKIGTCSWKYDSWRGLIYSDDPKINYLKEYSKHYNTVEVDQWFWSLFGVKKINLPEFHHVEAYRKSVGNNFKFSVKIPNSITLTHFYRKSKKEELKPNPHFLSEELTSEFLKTLEPLKENLGPLMFQFEYLNKQKMKSQQDFQIQFGDYVEKLDRSYQWGIEIRNPNYLNKTYFDFLKEYKLTPVFLQGYYMPSIIELIPKFIDQFEDAIVIRLHGPDRKGIEERAGGKWNERIEPKDEELSKLVEIIAKLLDKDIDIYLNVNNHYEGSAPLTINKIKELMKNL
ncbi:MAG: DUF72 domain-containing protein [Melioribacteraceae bacterium]|nr:DUF72 domain-containing protein [Melioribacteraceae bacterium]